MNRFIIPFVGFVVLAVFLYVGLQISDRRNIVESPLIGKSAPMFTLPVLGEPGKQFSPADMKGQVWLLNVWASWCGGCLQEHPVISELAKKNLVPIVGMDYKEHGKTDEEKDAGGKKWLAAHGNPYSLVIADREGRIAIDYGVYGVPETYVIDKQGIIRYKEIGEVTRQKLETKILPLIAELQKK